MEIFSDLRDLFFLKFVGTRTARQDWPGFYGMVAGMQREYKAMVVQWRCLVQHVVKLNSNGCSRGNPGENGDGGCSAAQRDGFLWDSHVSLRR